MRSPGRRGGDRSRMRNGRPTNCWWWSGRRPSALKSWPPPDPPHDNAAPAAAPKGNGGSHSRPPAKRTADAVDPTPTTAAPAPSCPAHPAALRPACTTVHTDPTTGPPGDSRPGRPGPAPAARPAGPARLEAPAVRSPTHQGVPAGQSPTRPAPPADHRAGDGWPWLARFALLPLRSARPGDRHWHLRPVGQMVSDFSPDGSPAGPRHRGSGTVARSTSGSRLVYVSAVMVIEEWPSISWLSFRSVGRGAGPAETRRWRPWQGARLSPPATGTRPDRRPFRRRRAGSAGRSVGRFGTVAAPNGCTLGGTWGRRRGRALQRAGRRGERHTERAAR